MQRLSPIRQLIDPARGLRRIGDAEPQHGGVAEPERQARHKTDFRHLDGVETVGRIDAVAHRAPGEHGGTDIVADRIAGETGKRRDPIRDFLAPDCAQGEPVVKREREIAAGDERGGGENVALLGCLQRCDHLVDIDIAQHVDQHHHRHGDDGQTEQHADSIPADIVLEKSRHRAQRIEHLSSGSAPDLGFTRDRIISCASRL